MMQKSTLKKLSQALGLSISTVSRALKDHPDISDSTRKKVKELAAAMEYEPNSYAVQLRTRKSNVIGVLIPTINNFFYDTFIGAVEEEARKHGYSLLIMQSGDNVETETACLQYLRQHNVMGLFVALSVQTENVAPFKKMEELEIPVIFIDRVPDDKGYYTVCLADEAAARMAAEAIIEKNKKNVLALFAHPQLSISKIRKESFINTFKAKAPKTNLTIHNTENPGTSQQILVAALTARKKPDVVFCMCDLILTSVMKAIHGLKLSIPKDIAVIAISNGFIPTLFNPNITYVETSGSKLGKLSFLHMLARLRSEKVPENVIVESLIVKGGSL
jgi:LacI family transcriptional regulator